MTQEKDERLERLLDAVENATTKSELELAEAKLDAYRRSKAE